MADGDPLNDLPAWLARRTRTLGPPHHPSGSELPSNSFLSTPSDLKEQAAVDRFVGDLQRLLPGNSRLSHPAICSGDHSSANWLATIS